MNTNYEERVGLVRRYVAGIILLVFGLTAGGSTQAVPETHRHKLQGVVLDSVTSAPIARALVELAGPVHKGALTDAEGRFEFDNVPEGSVTLSVEKPGYVGSGIYRGLKRNQLVVEVGSQEGFANLQLAPESVIAGKVVDEDGTPVEGAAVALIKMDIVEGIKQKLRLPAIVATDSDGNFRFAELGAGSYYVVVRTNSIRKPAESEGTKKEESYPQLVYYPASPGSLSAGALELTTGQQARIDVALPRTRVFQVSGAVTGRTFARQLGMQILEPSGDVLPVAVHFEGTGRFRIDSIPGGTYLVRMQMQSANGRIFTSEQSLNVSSSISGLQITLDPPVSIPITVRSEVAPGRSGQCSNTDGRNGGCSGVAEQNVTVVLHSDARAHINVHSVFEMSQGMPQLRLPDVQAGEYLVLIHSSRGYIESARCGRVNLLREKLVVRSGVAMPHIEVVVREDAASVGGRVRSQKAFREAFVVLAPEFAPAQPPVVIKTDSAGGFQQAGLAPGEYKVFAFDAIQQLEYGIPAVLAEYASRAARITLSANQDAQLNLDLIVRENE